MATYNYTTQGRVGDGHQHAREWRRGLASRLRARNGDRQGAALSGAHGETEQVGQVERGGDLRSQKTPMPLTVPHSEPPEKRKSSQGPFGFHLIPWVGIEGVRLPGNSVIKCDNW